MVAHGRKHYRTVSGLWRGSSTKSRYHFNPETSDSAVGHCRSMRICLGQVSNSQPSQWDSTTAWKARNCENKPSLLLSMAHKERKWNYQLEKSPAQWDNEQRRKILHSRGHGYNWSQQLQVFADRQQQQRAGYPKHRSVQWSGKKSH